MLQNKSGYRIYSGRAYTDIRKLREGSEIQNDYNRIRALNANEKLMKEFRNVSFKIPKGIPYNVRYVYRGDGLTSNTSYKIYKSYISFSRDKVEAYKYAKKHKNPVVFMLDLKSISKNIPIIYNGMWKFSSFSPHEKEIVLPPGKLQINRTPIAYLKPIHQQIPVQILTVTYIPDRGARDVKTGKVNPYRK